MSMSFLQRTFISIWLRDEQRVSDRMNDQLYRALLTNRVSKASISVNE